MHELDIALHSSLVSFHGTKYHLSIIILLILGFPIYREHLNCALLCTMNFSTGNYKLS